jgi:predicted dehydrogenase
MAVMDDPLCDMRATVAVTMENGAVATISFVGDSRYPARRVRNLYFGSGATALVEGLPFAVTVVPSGGSGTTVHEKEMPAVPGPAACFIDAIRNRVELPSGPLDGLRCVEVVEAAYRSARSGQRVALQQS